MEQDEPIPRWRTTTRSTLADNKFLRLVEHTRVEEGTGKEGKFFIVEAPDWGNVVAITENDELVMIEQFRQGSETIELEVPGGMIEQGEDPGDAMLRELTEETGYLSGPNSDFRKLGQVTPNPAFINNTCYTYLLTNVHLGSLTSFDEHENIRVRLIPRSEVESMIVRGEICHSLTITALYWLRLSDYK